MNKVYVLCGNCAENYWVVYDSLEEAQQDERCWNERELVIIGQEIETFERKLTMEKYLIDEETLKEFIRAERKCYCDYLDDKYDEDYCFRNNTFREMSDEEVLNEIYNRFGSLDDYLNDLENEE